MAFPQSGFPQKGAQKEGRTIVFADQSGIRGLDVCAEISICTRVNKDKEKCQGCYVPALVRTRACDHGLSGSRSSHPYNGSRPPRQHKSAQSVLRSSAVGGFLCRQLGTPLGLLGLWMDLRKATANP